MCNDKPLKKVGSWFTELGDFTQSQWDQRNRFTHETGGDKITDPAGLFTGVRDKYGNKQSARDVKAQAARDLALKPNPAPLPPSPTAMLVNPATELADRRRRAVLLARTNLTQPGPGANIPMG